MLSRKIKSVLAFKGCTASRLAEILGCSQANISQKLKRDDFRESELEQIAAALGCDLKIEFVDRETGRSF